jgi:DNA-binding LacI/PurR family transcriptional regulator
MVSEHMPSPLLHRQVGRPPVAQRRVLESVRGRILRGDFKPGDRLPSRRNLCERYGSGLPAAQEALDQLARDGFVESRGPRGTFVAARPPHLHRYVLAFDTPLREGPPNEYRRALAREAARISAAGQIAIEVMDNLLDRASHRGFDRLCEDLHRHRLAGLIFPSTPPVALRGTPILDEPGIRRVSVQPTADPDIAARVELDHHSLIDRALDDLADRGCRRIGVVRVGWAADMQEHLLRAARRRGLELPPCWDQQVGLSQVESAANLCHLMFHPEHGRFRPDGLFIADDNFVGACAAGLVAAGVRGSDDVRIVAHCNFPWPTPAPLPMHRVGFDVRTVLEQCIALLKRSPGRSRTPAVVRIQAVTQFDLPVDAINGRGHSVNHGTAGT